MAIESEVSKVTYNANGATTAFGITFDVLTDSVTGDAIDIAVVLTDSAGVETILTPTTEYTISGKTVTTVATYATGNKITILRDVPFTQDVDLIEGQAISGEVLERVSDKLTLQNQQQQEQISRVVRIPITESGDMTMPLLATRANKVLGFDAAGAPIAATGITAAVTDFALTVLDDADQDAARITLGIDKRVVEYGKRLGELYWLDGYEAPAAWNAASPDDYHPGLCLSAIDGYSDISTTNWPDLVPHLRDRDLVYLKGKTGEASSWTALVSGSDITMPTSTSSDAVLAALVEDQLVNGSYTNWRTVNVAGTDFVITAINTATRVITVTGTPAAGSQTVKFYPHRIAASTTTARVFEINGRTIVSAGDADGEGFAGLLRRDRMQQITGSIANSRLGEGSGAVISASGALAGQANTDGYSRAAADTGTGLEILFDSAGSPGARTGSTTDPRAMIGHLFIHGRSYVA